MSDRTTLPSRMKSKALLISSSGDTQVTISSLLLSTRMAAIDAPGQLRPPLDTAKGRAAPDAYALDFTDGFPRGKSRRAARRLLPASIARASAAVREELLSDQ
jgi:hypothetical protein